MKVCEIRRKKGNNDECRCDCKELDDSGSCKNEYMWNCKTSDCQYNKACKIEEYLDIKNCTCEKAK